MSNFSEALALALDGQKQNEFADAAGVDYPAVSNLRTGKREPTPDMVGRLINALDKPHQLNVMLAYLQDVALTFHKCGIPPSSYVIKPTATNEATHLLPPSLSANLRLIIDEAVRPKEGRGVRQMLEGLAHYIQMDRLAAEEKTGEPARKLVTAAIELSIDNKTERQNRSQTAKRTGKSNLKS